VLKHNKKLKEAFRKKSYCLGLDGRIKQRDLGRAKEIRNMKSRG